MPIGLQQLKFMVNLAYPWPGSLTLDEVYASRNRIPRGSQRLAFADPLVARGWVDEENGRFTLTNEGWEMVVRPPRKLLYREAYWWWNQTIKPRVNLHFLPRGPLSEPIKT